MSVVPGDIVSVGGRIGDNLGRTYVNVFVKEKWGDVGGEGEPGADTDGWLLADYLRPIRLSERGIHGRSTLELRYSFGELQRADKHTYTQYMPRTDRSLYVCIQVTPQIPMLPYTLWTGIIPVEQLAVFGTRFDDVTGDPLPAGKQTITAYGFEYLLERRALTEAPIIKTGLSEEDETEYQSVTHIPTFNDRLAKGRQLLGNRSAWPFNISGPPDPAPHTLASYGFANDRDENGDPYPWSHKDIIEFLFAWTDDFTQDDEPHFALAGDVGPPPLDTSCLDFLDTLYSVVRTDRRNVWDIVKELIDRRRGLGARFEWSVTALGFPDGAEDVVLHVFSGTDEPGSVGSILPPANPTALDLTIDDGRDVNAASVTLDAVNAYDTIVVKGERMQSCFSAASELEVPGPAPDDGDPEPDPTAPLAETMNIAPLTRAWSDADTTAYNSSTDAQRRRERHNRTFRMFELKGAADDSFQWETIPPAPEEEEPDTTRFLSPAFDANGAISLSQNGPFGNLDVRMLRTLPISEASDVAAEVAEQRFMKPFSLVEKLDDDSQPTGIWLTAHAPPKPDEGYDADDTIIDRPDVSGDVTPQQRSLEIDVHFKQGNHVLGGGRETAGESGNVFVPTEGKESDQDAVFDWRRMIITVAVETDARPTVTVQTNAPGNFHNRTKIIHVPDAHVWVVAPGTVVGVNDDGSLTFHSGSAVVRDDTDLLRATAALAKIFLGQDRATLTLTKRGIMGSHPIGTYVRSVLLNMQLQNVGNVVTERSYNFEHGLNTTWRTGHIDLDFVVRR